MDSQAQNQLLKIIDRQVEWRNKKLSAFKTAYLHQHEPEVKQVMAEAGIILVYAHVEGFVKETTKAYYSAMIQALQKVVPDQLSDQHLAMVLYNNYRKEFQLHKAQERSWIDFSTFIVQAFRAQQLPTTPYWENNSPLDYSKVNQKQLNSLLQQLGVLEDTFSQHLKAKLARKSITKHYAEVGTAAFEDLMQQRNAFAHGEMNQKSKHQGNECYLWYHDFITIAFFPTLKDCLLDAAQRWNTH